MSIARLGPIMQLAFVPADFGAALDYWTKVMGVGPFFHMQAYRRSSDVVQRPTYRDRFLAGARILGRYSNRTGRTA